MPAAGYIFHYSRSQASPPALPLIDLIGDVLRCGLARARIERRGLRVVSICRHYQLVSSPAAAAAAHRVNVFIAAFRDRYLQCAVSASATDHSILSLPVSIE